MTKIKYKKSKCFGTKEFDLHNSICNACRFIKDCNKINKNRGK